MLPAKSVLQILGDVALADADELRPGSIHVDVEGRRVESLLNARVRDSRNAGDLRQHFVCVGAVGLDFRADDLHIDRRRQAEVENLGHDVGRQEGESRAGKLAWQLFAHRLHVTGRLGLPAVVECDQDIRVGRAD